MYQKESLLKMQQHLASANQMPGLMIPPHFHNQFQGFQFRGFPGNFGGGRYPPAVRFHPGMDKPPFPPPLSPVSPHHPPPGPGFGLLSPDHNISMRWVMSLSADPQPVSRVTHYRPGYPGLHPLAQHPLMSPGSRGSVAGPGPPWPPAATNMGFYQRLGEWRTQLSALNTREMGLGLVTSNTSILFREYKSKNRLLLRAAQTASRN